MNPLWKSLKKKMKGRLDTCLHMAAYLLNPYYLYNDLEVHHDLDANDAVADVVETLYPEDYTIQNQIMMVEMPIYKGKLGKFGRVAAIKGCEVNDEKYDPGNTFNISFIYFIFLIFYTFSTLPIS